MKLAHLKGLMPVSRLLPRVIICGSKQAGVTLIELMVVLVIGLVVSLAIFGVMTASEGRKRTTDSVNDIDQSANYGLYQFDKLIRSAGTGFTQAYFLTYGCELLANKNGSAILPPPANTDLPKPFSAGYANILASIGNTFRLAPVIIVSGTRTSTTAGSNSLDSLIIMSGSAGLGEAPIDFTYPPTAPTLNVVNQAGFRTTTAPDADILAIVANRAASATTAMSPCMLEQVTTPFMPTANVYTVGLSGAFYTASGTTAGGVQQTLNNYTGVYSPVNLSSKAINLGGKPAFNIITSSSVSYSLYSYDLLSPNSTDYANPIVDGVFEMHALYGVDASNNGTITWQTPTGNYAAAILLNGSAASNATLKTIKALKIAMIMRAALPEKVTASQPAISPSSISIFTSASLTTPISIPIADTNYRYRVLESTIPLRNALL